MADIPEPTVKVTRYEVSCVPEQDINASMFTITVEYRGGGKWGVFRGGHRQLGADGTWSWGYQWPGGDREPATDEEHADYERGHDVWLAAHRFDEATALELAAAAAPHIRMNGYTVADALAAMTAED